MKAPITFAIAGFGDRGSTYASMQKLFPDRMKVVAVADINPEKVQKAKELYGIKDELCFTSAEEMLAQDKLADVMVVSTMDRQHVNHAIPALEKGYNILMEKPISPDLQECKRIIEVAKHCPGKIIVCHVLRYTTFYNTLKSILDSKKIGDVVSVCANENVGYWHQAHSFVRGNWRNSDQTSPMILQKCCHDMDIYTWLLGKKCKAISSVGDTHLFKKECAPEGATPYCLGGCKAKENCKFDAEKFPAGLPNIKVEKFGKEVWDPRDGKWKWSANAALVILDYYRSWLKVPDDEIRLDEFIQAANLCDERVAIPGGGTEARYTINMEFDLSEPRAKVLEAMLMACAGQPTYVGGKHGILAGAYYGPASDELRAHQLIGDLELLPEPSSSDKINQVAGTFVDPITFKKTDFPAVIVPESAKVAMIAVTATPNDIAPPPTPW